MFRWKKIILGLMVLICGVDMMGITVLSQDDSRGLVVQPAVYSIDLDRGNNYNYTIQLQNDSEEDNLNIQVTFETFTASSQEGLPQITPFQVNDPQQDWISVDTQQFSLNKNQTRPVNVALKIPQQAAAGGYYYAIIFNRISAPTDQSQVILNQRLVSLLFLNVKGEAARQVKFTDFKTNQYVYDPFFDFLDVTSDINLTGKSFYKPSGVIWSYQNSDKPFSSMPLNPDNRIILPDSTRTFEAVSKPYFSIPWLSNAGGKYDEWSKDQDSGFQRPWFGQVQLVANANYLNSSGDLDVVQAKTNILFIPWKSGLLVLFGGLIIWVGFYFRKKYFKKDDTKSVPKK
jgi:hypothetical protein